MHHNNATVYTSLLATVFSENKTLFILFGVGHIYIYYIIIYIYKFIYFSFILIVQRIRNLNLFNYSQVMFFWNEIRYLLNYWSESVMSCNISYWSHYFNYGFFHGMSYFTKTVENDDRIYFRNMSDFRYITLLILPSPKLKRPIKEWRRLRRRLRRLRQKLRVVPKSAFQKCIHWKKRWHMSIESEGNKFFLRG